MTEENLVDKTLFYASVLDYFFKDKIGDSAVRMGLFHPDKIEDGFEWTKLSGYSHGMAQEFSDELDAEFTRVREKLEGTEGDKVELEKFILRDSYRAPKDFEIEQFDAYASACFMKGKDIAETAIQQEWLKQARKISARRGAMAGSTLGGAGGAGYSKWKGGPLLSPIAGIASLAGMAVGGVVGYFRAPALFERRFQADMYHACCDFMSTPSLGNVYAKTLALGK